MNELIAQLVAQLGVNQEQAAGGAGAIFKLVKEHLSGADFGKLAAAIGGIEELIGRAPQAEGAAKLLGGFGSMFGGTAGSMAALGTVASAFKSLNLDSDMAAKFAPIILDFVRSKGGGAIADMLQEELARFVGK
jgi:hypothetical protein